LQISSIATLGQTNQWLDKTLFKSLRTSKSTRSPLPNFNIIFPTPNEVRTSLDGYEAGASIHTKIQTAAQLKQLQYLKPMLCRWAGNGDQNRDPTLITMEAGRRQAAPHIKTYIRFCDAMKTQIEWALVTSANISKQAWGEACNSAGESRICSYELGVLVWPQLWAESAKMVPTFKHDTPMLEDRAGADGKVSYYCGAIKL
jgi:tyrosyl-DNA phosphodiesterase 1